MTTKELRRTTTGVSFVLPAALVVLLFSLGSMIVSFYVSLHRWDILIPVHPFAGLDNYREVLFSKDTLFWVALVNTAYYVALVVPSVIAASFILALFAQRAPFGQPFFKAAFFLPSITPIVVVSLIWMWLYKFDGPLNTVIGGVLSAAGAPGGPPNWLTDPRFAMPAIVIMTAWQASGYYSVIFLAGLADIPREFYEAAEVDGAGFFRGLWHITIPLLRNTFVFSSVMLIISAFQVFTQVYIMTRGGPGTSTEVLTSRIFKGAFQTYGGLGSACAMSWLLFAVVFVFVLVYMKVVRSRQIYD